MIAPSQPIQNKDSIPAPLLLKHIDDPSRRFKAPPQFGLDFLPHIFTVAGRYGVASHAYSTGDVALLHSRQNAELMRNELAIMECVETRMRSTSLLNHHIEPADDSIDDRTLDILKQRHDIAGQINSNQHDAEEIAAKVALIWNRTRDKTKLLYSLMDACWYGRTATVQHWHTIPIQGLRDRAIAIRKWEPRHGDKLVFRYDDDTFRHDPDQLGIRVGSGYNTQKMFVDYAGNKRRKIEATQYGLAYWIDGNERRSVALHKHIIEDGDFDHPIDAGKIHGVGIRSRIYWTWYAYEECLKLLLEYIERSALGIEIWNYPAHNEQAKNKAMDAAQRRGAPGRSILMVPRMEGEQADMYGVDIVEPGLGGADVLQNVLEKFFGHKIKRYILGQTLTSEAESTGLGSSVADAHKATYADIVRWDALGLAESVTHDIIRQIQLLNFPGSEGIWLNFKFDTESADAQSKLEAYAKAFEMGAAIKTEDIYAIIGASRPSETDDVLSQQGMMGQGPLGDGAPTNGNIGPDGANPLLEGTTMLANGSPVDMAASSQDMDAGYLETNGAMSGVLDYSTTDAGSLSQYGRPPRFDSAEPSDAQAKAGNYKKATFFWNGLKIKIENPKGSKRSGVGKDGKPWEVEMVHPYGYFSGHKGADGDELDVILGNELHSEIVFLVDQEKGKGKGRFDEHKVIIGCTNEAQAKRAYLANYSKGWKVGPITSMTVPQFKAWLDNGDQKKRVEKQVSKFGSRGVTAHAPVLDQFADAENCGANAPGGGGFQPGNTCAKGGGSSSNPFEGRQRLAEDFEYARGRIDKNPQYSQAISELDHVNPDFNKELLRHIAGAHPELFERIKSRAQGIGIQSAIQEIEAEPQQEPGGDSFPDEANQPEPEADPVETALAADDHATAYEHLSKLKKADLEEKWRELAGRGFYQKTKKQMLEEIQKAIPHLTASATAKFEKEERESQLAWKLKRLTQAAGDNYKRAQAQGAAHTTAGMMPGSEPGDLRGQQLDYAKAIENQLNQMDPAHESNAEHIEAAKTELDRIKSEFQRSEQDERQLQAASGRVSAMKQRETEQARESNWQQLMAGKQPDMDPDEAIDHLARLNAAPGDNPAAREYLESKRLEKLTEPEHNKPRQSSKAQTSSPLDLPDDPLFGEENRAKAQRKAQTQTGMFGEDFEPEGHDPDTYEQLTGQRSKTRKKPQAQEKQKKMFDYMDDEPGQGTLFSSLSDFIGELTQYGSPNQRRAKPGGERGENGEWYKGGQWINESGDEKREKPKRPELSEEEKQKLKEAREAETANRERERREWKKRDDEEAKARAEDRRRWDAIRSGPIGEMQNYSDEPFKFHGRRVKQKWRPWAEEFGEDNLRKLIDTIKPIIQAEQMERYKKRDTDTDEEYEDIKDWVLNRGPTQEIKSLETYFLTKAHAKKVPSSIEAFYWVEEFQGDGADVQHTPWELHNIVKTILDPDDQETERAIDDEPESVDVKRTPTRNKSGNIKFYRKRDTAEKAAEKLDHATVGHWPDGYVVLLPIDGKPPNQPDEPDDKTQRELFHAVQALRYSAAQDRALAMAMRT